MRNLFYSLLGIIGYLSPLQASDTLESVHKAYLKSMKWAEEIIPLTDQANKNLISFLNKEKDLLPGEFKRNNPESEVNVENSPSSPFNIIKHTIAAATGLNSEDIYSKEEFYKKNENSWAQLFHSFNATITTIFDYMTFAKKDEESLKWTYNNSLFTLENGEKLPLEGPTMWPEEVQDSSHYIMRTWVHRQVYEYERQKIHFELTGVWNLFVFWKKVIFSENSINSFNSINAAALINQIKDFYKIRKEAFNKLPYGIQQKNKDTYTFQLLSMVEKVCANMPMELHSSVLGKATRSSILKKMEGREKEVIEKEKKFVRAYQDYLSQIIRINCCLGYFQQKPWELSSNPSYRPKFEKLYKKLQNFKFPEAQRRVNFSSSPLDFDKLMPDAVHETLGNIPLGLEISPSVDETPDVVEESLPTAQISETISANPSGETSENLPEKVSENSSEGSLENSLEIVETPLEEERAYDNQYWEELNRYHRERKAAARLPISGAVLQPALTPYEKKLYTYLNENVYTYVEKKVRRLIKELTQLNFTFTINNVGKGKMYYVSPHTKNPLFGNHPDYSEAYFNIHLPHNDGDIVPSGYFNYIQSGFGNVFGLTREEITRRLAQEN